MNINQKIRTDFYKNKLKFVSFKENPAAYKVWAAEDARLHDLFREEALESVGLKDHPKADKVWNKAWDFGHANGFSDVYYYLQELAEIVL